MMKLQADLAATLFDLAGKVHRGEIRSWQIERIAAALSGEVRILQQIEAADQQMPVRVARHG